MSLFAEVDLLKKELDELRPLSPEQEARILQKFRLDWNYNSNAIEGNSLTLGETRSLLLHGLTAAGKPIRDHLDIKGHNEAVLWLEEIVRDERPLTEQFIRGMHEVLLGEGYDVPAQTPDGQPTRKHIQPGRYKSGPNNVQTATGEMFYFASPEETPGKMTDLVDWYRQESDQATMHPVALAAEFHYRFVRIHPFDDGNGRMSRLLMNLILMRRGYPMTVIKATDRNRYLAALAEADAGEIGPFFQFISENVESSLQLMIRAAKGESIEEPDDLDKKLAILKAQLLNRNDKIEALWSKETEINFYNTLFIPWIEKLGKQSEKFDFAFMQKAFGVDIYYGDDYEPNYGESTNDITAITSSIVSRASLIEQPADTLSFYIRWGVFKQSENPFDVNLLLEFYFSKTLFHAYYEIHDKSGDNFRESEPTEDLYVTHSIFKSSYPEIDIDKLNYTIANNLYNFIEKKMNGSDNENYEVEN